MIQTVVAAAVLYIATAVDLLVILLIFLLEQRLEKNIEIFMLVNI
ncbi:cadmium resistance transporter [Staphylococcus aureus]|nr:cadmium resistance transporter [Staphylococcus aureus]